MIAVNLTTAQSKFKEYCDKAADSDETIVVTRNDEKGVVVISIERYNELIEAKRTADFYEKLERGLAQVHAGQGIEKKWMSWMLWRKMPYSIPFLHETCVNRL